MSRAAQAVEQLVKELAAKQQRQRRTKKSGGKKKTTRRRGVNSRAADVAGE